MEVPEKLKIELPYDPAIPLLGIQLNLEQQRLVALTLCPVENPSITYSWSFCIHDSASMDSINFGSCSTVVFTIEKKSLYKCTLAIQTCDVQGSIVYPKETKSLS